PTATDVKNALENLPQVGAGNVLVTGTGTSIDPYTIKFIGALGGGRMPLLKVGNSQLTGGATSTPNISVFQNSDGLTISAGRTGSAAGRKDRRGRLTLSGNNGGLVGQINVMNGVVALNNIQGLGGQAADKVVNAGAAVEINTAILPPTSTIQENWVLNGTGFGSDNSGALRIFGPGSGGSQLTLLGSITIGSNNTVIEVGSHTPAGASGLSEAITSSSSMGSKDDIVNFNGRLDFGVNLNTIKMGVGALSLDGNSTNGGAGG